jgi:hypothetical protein
VREIQCVPYLWPAPPDAASARRARAGTCASKHAWLTEELDALGIVSLPLLVVGPLVPRQLADAPDLRDGAALLEVHECLTVLTPWAGPLRVDVTWDPPLAAHGLPATLEWDGSSDMRTAVDATGPGWSLPRDGLRDAKEALRARLYAPGERSRRDRTLAALAARFSAWRTATR